MVWYVSKSEKIQWRKQKNWLKYLYRLCRAEEDNH